MALKIVCSLTKRQYEEACKEIGKDSLRFLSAYEESTPLHSATYIVDDKAKDKFTAYLIRKQISFVVKF